MHVHFRAAVAIFIAHMMAIYKENESVEPNVLAGYFNA